MGEGKEEGKMERVGMEAGRRTGGGVDMTPREEAGEILNSVSFLYFSMMNLFILS